MNDFERSKWQHPSSRNRVNAEIELMELMLRTSENPIEPPAVKRAKRGGRRKPRGYYFPWR